MRSALCGVPSLRNPPYCGSVPSCDGFLTQLRGGPTNPSPFLPFSSHMQAPPASLPPLPATVLSNLASAIPSGVGRTFIPNVFEAFTFTTPATDTYALPYVLNTFAIVLGKVAGGNDQCTVSITATSGGLPTGSAIGVPVQQTINTTPTQRVLYSFTGLAATLNPSTTYAAVLSCINGITTMLYATAPMTSFDVSVFTPGNYATKPVNGVWSVVASLPNSQFMLELSTA